MNIKWVFTLLLSFFVLIAAVSTKAEVLISDTQVYKHSKSSGGNGVDSIQLSAPRTTAKNCAVFKKAMIKYTKRRYGKVEIIKNPKAQCNPQKEQCKLGVSWKHSPAGRLGYKVKVTWVLKPC